MRNPLQKFNTQLPVAFAAMILTAACAPKIDEMTVGTGEPGERLPVSAQVSKNQTTIQGVELDVRADGAADFAAAGSMTGSGGAYSGQTPRLGPGTYEARVRVLYKAVFQSAVKTKSATRSFSLEWPPGTFGFENGGLNGWRYAGVFGVSDDFEACDPAVLAAPPHFSFSQAGWPVGINDTGGPFVSGSLRTSVSFVCYPDSASEVNAQGLWNFNLLSPDLSTDSNWQGISGVSFRVNTNSPFPIHVVSTVVFEDENGNNQPSSPMLTPTQMDFTEIATSQQWITVAKTWNIPDRPIRSVELRVFGSPESLAGSPATTVLIDVVSPIP
jgi:hypothetical protein